MGFLIVSVIIFNLIAYVIPKRISLAEMYTTSLFAVCLELIVDIFLDLKYQLYGFFEIGVQYRSLILIAGIYPSLNIIFLNYYPFGSSMIKRLYYILGWVIFSLIFEWLSLKAGYFYYNGWKLWYSILPYFIIYLTLLANFKLIRRVTF